MCISFTTVHFFATHFNEFRRLFPGTDANVSLTVWGSKGSSGTLLLKESGNINKFERNQATNTRTHIYIPPPHHAALHHAAPRHAAPHHATCLHAHMRRHVVDGCVPINRRMCSGSTCLTSASRTASGLHMMAKVQHACSLACVCLPRLLAHVHTHIHSHRLWCAVEGEACVHVQAKA